MSDDGNGLDIWGLQLNSKNSRPLPLITGKGQKYDAVVTGDHIFWRNLDSMTGGIIENTSLSAAFADGPEKEKIHEQNLQAAAKSKPSINQATTSPETGPPYPAPSTKGIFTPRNNFNGNYAWTLPNNTGTTGVDALVYDRTDRRMNVIRVKIGHRLRPVVPMSDELERKW